MLVYVDADKSRCAFTRTCQAIAPHVFGRDPSGAVEVLVSPTVLDEDLLEAIESCPVEALLQRPADRPG